jgi:ribosomal protein S18 acetylase RimI-like enzyme
MAVPFVAMRKLHREPAATVHWPAGIQLAHFSGVEHAEAVHSVLTEAHATGGAHVDPFDTWWSALQDDAEYEPSLVLLATEENGTLAGVAQCWTSSFIKDLAVSANWRRRGLGFALLNHAFNVFRSRGSEWVDLKVEIGNPSGAERLYRRAGMTQLYIG